MATTSGPLPPINHPDPYQNMRGYIPATEYATSYVSNHTQNTIPAAVLPLLGSLNCSYLSHQGGRPPTLLALKQHAQALTILIRHLSISTTMGEIDAAHLDAGARAFQPGDAFDWLNDLGTAYTNTDDSHNLPLTTLMNQVERQTDMGGPQFHCPLKEVAHPDADQDDAEAKSKPYSSHHNLLMHASECLEVLDHEYSATGGIMSILPTEDATDTADMASARNCLVGQWLLFTQHLVARMHELETSYGQSLDVLAGEAVVPMQTHGRLGPVGAPAAGRQVAYPQDRWVLANAGDDVFEHLHRLFDVEEGQYEERQRIWRAAGVSGQRVWMEERGGEEWSRGIVTLDVVTRYYRLKGSGRSTIFVIPAWQFHPRCASMATIEKEPTVVAVPAPLWPTRVSDWEARNRKKMAEGETSKAELVTVTKRVVQQSRQVEFLREELVKAKTTPEVYEEAFTGDARDTVKNLGEEMVRYRAGIKKLREALPEEHQSLLDELDPGEEDENEEEEN